MIGTRCFATLQKQKGTPSALEYQTLGGAHSSEPIPFCTTRPIEMIEIVFASLAAGTIFLIVIGLAFLSRLYRRLGTATLELAMMLFLTTCRIVFEDRRPSGAAKLPQLRLRPLCNVAR